MIDKKLHFVWLGSPLPDKEKRNIESWNKYNPDLDITIWTKDNISELNISDSAMEAIELGEGIYAYQSDIIRYHAIHEHGGFYSDTDIECFRKLDSDWFYCDHVMLKSSGGNWITNAFFGSRSNSIFLETLIQSIKPTNKEDVEKRRCYIFGPVFINRILCNLSNNKGRSVLDIDYPQTKVLDPWFWSSLNKERYCKHYANASWLKR
jgi:mannosyltransferase OCH1-like enzyme